MKTSELISPALDWAVAKCEGLEFVEYKNKTIYVNKYCPLTGDFEVQYGFKPSVYWNQGGPIIEREKIVVAPYNNQNWHAWPFSNFDSDSITGTTPLIAAMRCYVASKLGDEVDIPEELKG